MVLLNGPVKNALFCLMDRYRNVCVWFMARNCRFPKIGTHGCQRGNQRLPLQGFAGSQKLEFMFSKLSNYHCKGFPKLETHGSKPEKVTLPVEGSVDCKKLDLMVLNAVLFCLLSR